eukprot:m.264329 g.264329  ORF g.264329 m.264329 type:complete len:830 (+) comp55607_c0_seq1:15-2504(+)
MAGSSAMVVSLVTVLASTLVQSLDPALLSLTNCTDSSASGWTSANGILKWNNLCATSVYPIQNDGLVVAAECDNASTLGQTQWILNSTFFDKSPPNVSTAILVNPEKYGWDTLAGYGWTYDKGEAVGARIQLFDIGARFHGECTGNNNCQFKLTADGKLMTFQGRCVTGTAPPPPPPTTAPTAPPMYNGTATFAAAMGDNMVLQQAPSQAAAYGPVGKDYADTDGVRLTVSDGTTSYSIAATIQQGPLGLQWKALLKAAPSGGSYTLTLEQGTTSVAIVNVTFGDVWYCGGQSNMALPILHTFSRNISRDAILSGKYSNIRISGVKGNMNPTQPWTTLINAVTNVSQADVDSWYGYKSSSGPSYNSESTSRFFQFSATCYYFAESLTQKLGDAAPPIGLIHTAFGGSMIEEWIDEPTINQCAGTSPSYQPFSLYEQNVLPYVDTTVKGWLWYQGENNCHGVMGNSLKGVGYGCMLPAMVELWRAKWSQTQGTTHPLAPFGVVTLASGGSEGGNDIGGMRWSQTSNFGTLPSPQIPNSFLAHAYDLGDPWTGGTPCTGWQCCANDYNASNCAQHTKNDTSMCTASCLAQLNTSFYMGPIHPRVKKPVGDRLAAAAAALVYGSTSAYAGPTIKGCSVAGDTITIRFNETLLRGGNVMVKPYDKPTVNSAMRVLIDERYFCNKTILIPKIDSQWPSWFCADEGAPEWGQCGGDVQCGADSSSNTRMRQQSAVLTSPPQAPWVLVDIKSSSSTEVVLDLSSLPSGATPLAVRYAWDNDKDSCCPPLPQVGSLVPCAPGSCPIWDEVNKLPANPFIAMLDGGKCKCIAPQTCDE